MTNFVKHVFFAKVGKVGESDPLSSDPLSSDPLSSDPLSSDIETILLRAGTRRVPTYKSGTKAVPKGTKALQKRYKKLQKLYKNGTKTVQKLYISAKTVQDRDKNETTTVKKKCSKRQARLPLKST